MPSLNEYQFLANLLALPQSIPQQAQATDAIRSALGQQGFTPEQVNAVAPEPGLRDFPGNNVPALGTFLRGLGTVGQVLQGVTGAPSAPRLPLGQFVALQQLQNQNTKQKALGDLAGSYTNPRARALATAGFATAAEAAEGGKVGPSGELQQLIQHHLDLGEDMTTARANALLDIDKRREARARASAGASAGARLGGEAQGFQADQPYFPGTGAGGPRPQPQAGTPGPAPSPQPIGAPGAPSPSAFQPAVYRVAEDGRIQQVASVGEQPSGAVSGIERPPRGGRLQLPGGSTLEFAEPEVANEFQAMMRTQKVDPLTGTPADAQRLLDNWQAYKQHELVIRERVAREEKPLTNEDRTAIVAMRLFQDQVHTAITEFTPEERHRFAGYFKQGGREFAQIYLRDPRFAQWDALVGQIEAAKFGEGGKQLTPTEAAVVEKYVPTGREWGGDIAFDAKAADFLHRADFLIRERLRLATESGTQYRKEYEKLRGKYFAPALKAPSGANIPSGADIEAAKRELGL